MKCPVCTDAQLDRTKHAGFNVYKCGTCSGHLVESRRLDPMIHRVNKDPEQLANVIQTESAASVEQPIRCPRCNNRMDKKPTQTSPEFELDSCRNCDFNWLDGGELAKLELAVEFEVQRQEVTRMRERLNEMSAEEKAEFERRVAEMPEFGDPFTDGIKAGIVNLTAFVALQNWLQSRRD